MSLTICPVLGLQRPSIKGSSAFDTLVDHGSDIGKRGGRSEVFGREAVAALTAFTLSNRTRSTPTSVTTASTDSKSSWYSAVPAGEEGAGRHTGSHTTEDGAKPAPFQKSGPRQQPGRTRGNEGIRPRWCVDQQTDVCFICFLIHRSPNCKHQHRQRAIPRSRRESWSCQRTVVHACGRLKGSQWKYSSRRQEVPALKPPIWNLRDSRRRGKIFLLGPVQQCVLNSRLRRPRKEPTTRCLRETRRGAWATRARTFCHQPRATEASGRGPERQLPCPPRQGPLRRRSSSNVQMEFASTALSVC